MADGDGFRRGDEPPNSLRRGKREIDEIDDVETQRHTHLANFATLLFPPCPAASPGYFGSDKRF